MTPELTALALAGLLHAFQGGLMSLSANLQLPKSKTFGTHDTSLAADLSGTAARLYRAFNNSIENLMFFGIAVLVVTAGDQSTVLTQICAWTYLAARILYIQAYVYGWVPLRSYIWTAGFLATTLMLIAALIP